MSELKFLTLNSSEFWRSAAKEFKSIRTLCIAALFVALHTVLSMFYIPISQSLQIHFTFIADIICSIICGPLVGILCGIAADLISFMMHPEWGFFPGYTLTCVLTFVVYGLYLYRRKLSILRVLLARLTVNLFINVGLGCVWSAILYGKGYYYYFATSVVKNLAMLPIEVIVMCVVLRLLLPGLISMKLIPPQKKLPIIK